MKRIVAIFMFVITFVVNGADAINHLGQYDLRSYHPENYGLKDLVFDIRIDGLVSQLNSNKSFGKLEDVFITVYWMQPGQYRLEVNGFKGGFNEYKAGLKNQIKPLLKFVIPEKVVPNLRSYELKVENNSDEIKISGKERTNKAAIGSIELVLDGDHRLSSTKLMSPGQVLDITYDHEKKSWSHNKWLVSKVTTKSKAGSYLNSSATDINYKRFEGFGFPEQVTITNKVVSMKEKKEKELSKNSIVFKFSNYRVNRNIAKNYILKR